MHIFFAVDTTNIASARTLVVPVQSLDKGGAVILITFAMTQRRKIANSQHVFELCQT